MLASSSGSVHVIAHVGFHVQIVLLVLIHVEQVEAATSSEQWESREVPP